MARIGVKREVFRLNSLAHHSTELGSSSVVEELIPTVTIVICTRNRAPLLHRCLESIARLQRTPDEVIVVDNTRGDSETKAVVRAFGATYIIEPIQGVSRARNRGLAESHSEIVAYLDDDVTPDVNWLGYLLEPFKDPQVAVVTGKVVTPLPPVVGSAKRPIRSVSKKDPEWFELAAFGGLGLESNMAFRRDTCAGERVFDERLGRGAPFQVAEGHYAFALLLSRGYTAVRVPEAIVFHAALTRGEVKQEARNSIAYSLLLFSEFPSNRIDLLRFLFRRARRKQLNWPRDSPDPGDIITSGWGVLLPASLSAIWLFLRTRKLKNK
jgi:glycosyltransferase involved in cell wall biosynthesis